MKAVVKISGSLFDEDDAADKIRSFAEVLDEFQERGNLVAAVVGGGRRSRELIELGRKIGASEDVLDEVGIDLTRINAKILISALRNSYPKVIIDLREAEVAWSLRRIPVAGGLSPGHSTNAVAALLAEHLRADLFVNLTKAGAVYDRDPSLYRDARALERVTIEDLRRILKGSFEAGTYELIDDVAVGIIERSRIRTVIAGMSAADLRKALYGERIGSIVVFE